MEQTLNSTEGLENTELDDPGVDSGNTFAEKIPVRCLNCGCEVTDLYCSKCGQSVASQKRITMKTLGKSFGMSFARLTPGFWDTFTGLLLHPWVVIREYLNGKRVKYSPPITMVIQLLLYFTFFYSLLGFWISSDPGFAESENAIDAALNRNPLLRVFNSSDVVMKVLFSLPISCCCILVYKDIGVRRYNFAEYLVAAIYMGCAFSIYNNLFARLIGFIIPDTQELINAVIVLVVGTVSIFNAFHVESRRLRWWLWLKFIILNLLWFAAFVWLIHIYV